MITLDQPKSSSLVSFFHGVATGFDKKTGGAGWKQCAQPVTSQVSTIACKSVNTQLTSAICFHASLGVLRGILWEKAVSDWEHGNKVCKLRFADHFAGTAVFSFLPTAGASIIRLFAKSWGGWTRINGMVKRDMQDSKCVRPIAREGGQ